MISRRFRWASALRNPSSRKKAGLFIYSYTRIYHTEGEESIPGDSLGGAVRHGAVLLVPSELFLCQLSVLNRHDALCDASEPVIMAYDNDGSVFLACDGAQNLHDLTADRGVQICRRLIR